MARSKRLLAGVGVRGVAGVGAGGSAGTDAAVDHRRSSSTFWHVYSLGPHSTINIVIVPIGYSSIQSHSNHHHFTHIVITL